MLFAVLRYMNGVIFMSHTDFVYPRNTQTHTEKIIVEDYFQDFILDFEP